MRRPDGSWRRRSRWLPATATSGCTTWRSSPLIHLDYLSGAWQGLAERAEAWLAADDEPLFRLDAQFIAASLRLAATGGAAADEAVLRLVREEGQRRGVTDLLLEPTAAQARVRLAAGDTEAAIALTEEPVRLINRKGIRAWATDVVPVRVDALTAIGLRDRAERLADDFAGGMSGRDSPASAAALAVCRAVLREGAGEFGAAARAWSTAADAWRSLPRPYDALLARERAGRCLMRAGGEAGAGAAELLGVAGALQRLGAHHDARRVLSTPGIRPTGRPAYGDQLSPREREVVRLVLAGLTNRQIAEALTRSPKTIAAQLNSAMRKYGVTSRTALAVTVAQEGLGSV
jgi:DNA-binding CsgD family transcriptional regulator